ncbi:MAG: proline racemase family protein [Actinomycetota bacterium]|nr:proline racemase family protein [Actinomycetota bacterium]
MEFSHIYRTVETHTAGEPFRIVIGGVPLVPGATMLERRRWVQDNLDGVRTTLMHEPRGHDDMYGCYLTAPASPDADLGVVFMHNQGYSTMCGHGIIALATVVVAEGLVARESPETRVGIDTPAGPVEALVEWDGRAVGRVRFRNVPSFLYQREVEIETADFGALRVDVAFGGAFYSYLPAAQAGLQVEPEQCGRLVELGDQVKHAVEEALDVVHPEEPELRGIYGAVIDGPSQREGAHQVNVCVFAERQVDRSPTGTGTSGRMAQLHALGRLSLGETFVNESIIGTRFSGRVLQETAVGELPAVLTEVSGRASIVGFCEWVVQPDDPVGQGFLLR